MQAIDTRGAGAAIATLVIVQLSNPMVSDPLVDVVRVKPDKLADLVERHPPFLDKPSNESFGHAEVNGEGRNIEQQAMRFSRLSWPLRN